MLAVANTDSANDQFHQARSHQSAGLGGNHQRGYGRARDVFYDADGDPKIIGRLHLPVYLKVVGWTATGIMALAAIGMFITSGK